MNTKDDWVDLLDRISSSVNSGTFDFSSMHVARIKGKEALSTKYIEDTLVLRKINDNVRRAYGIRQPNRASLTRTVLQALQENTPKTITRLDIKRCFESINRKETIEELLTNSSVSHPTIALIERLFRSTVDKIPTSEHCGLPRGLIVSTTLAEIRLRELDRRIREIEDVYLLIRYVDDILVFSTNPGEGVYGRLLTAIHSTRLKPNLSKSKKPQRVACKCDVLCLHTTSCPCDKKCVCYKNNEAPLQTEFIGYNFVYAARNRPEYDANEVICRLSKKKVNKTKTRIFLAFRDFTKTGDHELLISRIKYLSGNQAIRAAKGRRPLLSGLAFTHEEYTREKESESPEGTIQCIDRFYRMSLRRVAKKLAPPFLKTLEKLTFSSGFKHKRRTKFKRTELIQIRRCWSNA